MPDLPPQIPAEAMLIDRMWFGEHARRKLRLRAPIGDEYASEFRQFGMHEMARRRIIVAVIPERLARRHKVDYMRIPFLLFADETVEDTDEVLAPILDRIMRDAANV